MQEIQKEFKCKPHKSEALYLINTFQQDSDMYLLCNKCFNRLESQDNNVISLSEVKQCNDNSLIDNWPSGLEISIIDKITAQASINYQKDLIDRLQLFQENLIYDITRAIKDVIIKQIDILKEIIPENRLLKSYHSLFQTKKLIEMVNQFDGSNYESFLKEFEQTRKENIQQILKSVKQFDSCEKIISFENLEQTKVNILNIISNMKFFNDNEANKHDDNEYNNNYINNEMQMKLNNNEEQKYKYLEEILKVSSKQSNCNESTFNNLIKLLEKKKEIDQIGFEKSLTKQYLDQNLQKISEQFDEKEIQLVFQQFPIFDLCTKKLPIFPINIIGDIMFQKPNVSKKENKIKISKNNLNQIEVSLKKPLLPGPYSFNVNCVSNIILQKKNKYVFRIHIKSERINPMIGLVSSDNPYSDIYDDDGEQFCFHLFYSTNDRTLVEGADYGISKKIKGDTISLSSNCTLEMRVWQEGQLLEVTDYPDYKYKVALKDEYKQTLKTMDWKLYFKLYRCTIKYTLKEAFIVDKFDD